MSLSFTATYWFLEFHFTYLDVVMCLGGITSVLAWA